ncbi:MAG TPA: endonuclease/exonuclease/phosphatase family protein [Nevskiaceae bacterium]|nr:endonuclease/exonuclease/phosphatase family protein [Nevskiaceae bacterium]
MNSKRAEQALRTRVAPRGASATTAAPCLRLLSYNIQAGLATRGYRDYVTGAWRYVLPTHERSANLRHIARTMRDYDFVAIQEADAGSLRTQQRNLVEWLARVADFPHHGFAVTRDMGPLAQICLGFLSRVPVERYSHYPLPGPIPGRGALEVDIQPEGLGTLTVVVTQMALGGGARALQLRYLATRLRGRRAVVVGDFNERRDGLQHNRALRSAGLTPLPQPPATYPSWRPRLSLDQVLVMPGLQVVSAHAVPVALSDHLPLAVEVTAAP